MIAVRRARPEDLPVIVEMVGHFIASTSYCRLLRFVPEAVAELTDRVLQVGVIFVAEDGPQLVGVIAGLPIEEPIGRTKMLDELVWWIEPAYRNRSAGPRLHGAWESWAREAGLEAVRMIAPADSPEVGSFYAKRGYWPLETSFIKRL